MNKKYASCWFFSLEAQLEKSGRAGKVGILGELCSCRADDAPWSPGQVGGMACGWRSLKVTA